MNITIEKKKSTPVYLQIKESLLSYIKKHDLSAGTALPSVKKVALSAGVSTRTADQALQSLIDDGICFRRPKNGTFVAKKISHNQDNDQRNIVGLFHFHSNVNRLENPVEELVFQGIGKQAMKKNIDLTFLSGHPANTLHQYTNVPDVCFLGMLAYSHNYEEILSLAKAFPNMRFVVINYYRKGFESTPDNVFGIFNDDFGGSYNAADYFITKGAKHIGYLSMSVDDDNYHMRKQGAETAAHDNNILFSPCELPPLLADEQLHAGYNAARKMLTLKPDIDTVMGVNDILTTGAALYLKEHEPTKKIWLCGYDHIVRAIPNVRKFCSVGIDFIRMGKKAIDIFSKKQPPMKAIRLYPKLILENQDGYIN